jgi:hypothetical protein
MRKSGLALIASIVMACGSVGFAQTRTPAADRSASTTQKADVTYGRIKELTPGQKVVVDVDNKMDKSFDLTDKDKTYHLASGLKVGDPVMVTERDHNGKKMVDIARHAGDGVKHGDKTRAEEVEQNKK